MTFASRRFPRAGLGMPALSIAAGALVLPACGMRQPLVDQAPEITVLVVSSPDPPQVGPAQLTLHLAGPDGAAIRGAQIELRGDMAHAGMAPVLVEATELEPGAYPLELEWSMAGDWVLTIQAALPDGRWLLRTVPLQVHPGPTVP